jgi:hypothetical protein
MNTWLTIDFIAQRYSCLPSEVLRSGSSIDVECANLAVAYENYLRKQEENKDKGVISSDYSDEYLQSMLTAVRNKD